MSDAASPTITIVVDDPEALGVIRRQAQYETSSFRTDVSPFSTSIQIQSDDLLDQPDGASIEATESWISARLWQDVLSAPGTDDVETSPE